MLGIIGGSGFYFLKGKSRKETVETPYGDVEVDIIKLFKKEVAFIPRHGKGHALPPHKVNYRANIHALNELDITAVFGTYAVGIISKRYYPGDLILIDDFIGLFTPITFFDDFTGGMKHVDFSNPYDDGLKDILAASAKESGIKLKSGGIVATTVGPRFETKSEIKALGSMGANLVSMTHAYEATLIGELELPFAAIAIGTNYACGVSRHKLTTEEVIKKFGEQKEKVNSLVNGLIEEVD